MGKILLKAEKRTEVGKAGAKKLRKQDMLPAVIYGKDFSMPIKLQKSDILKVMTSGAGEHTLINIEIKEDGDKKKEHWTIIKDYQLDPIRNELLHVDFMEISLKERIKIMVPIIITKEPIGVKKGGILQHQLREVEVECLPTEMPDGIEVDASSLDIGHSLHVSDLPVKEGVRLLSDPQEVVLTVIAPVVEEEAVPAAEEEVAEPELVKKAKPEEEEAEEEQQKEQKEQREK
jgi:large subunit ribosomal protein L25